jgi:ketosteroid isomerase-like protein
LKSSWLLCAGSSHEWSGELHLDDIELSVVNLPVKLKTLTAGLDLQSALLRRSVMSTPTQVVQQAYAAFGRGDVEGILALLTDDVRWRFVASAGIPYAGEYTGKLQVRGWFGTLAESDDIQKFEPREFLEGPDHVTVLGWEQTKPRPNGKVFESEWVHVFTLKNDKISRWIGTLDTAAYVAAGR